MAGSDCTVMPKKESITTQTRTSRKSIKVGILTRIGHGLSCAAGNQAFPNNQIRSTIFPLEQKVQKRATSEICGHAASLQQFMTLHICSIMQIGGLCALVPLLKTSAKGVAVP